MSTDDLKQAIERALLDASLPRLSFSLEHPSDLSHGDVATNVALLAGKHAGKVPHELATQIAQHLLDQKLPFVEAVEVAGAGFINIRFTRAFFSESLRRINERGESWGRGEDLKSRRIMVEYTQPNPFKVFHIGHLMSNAIGESVSRVIEFSGAMVSRANYQGDVGPHVAKAIWGIQKLKLHGDSVEDLGKAYVAGSEAYETDEAAKKEIDAINAAIYQKTDAHINELYEAGRKASLSHFDEIYAKLGTRFDHFFFESQTGPIGKEIIQSRPDVFEKSEGATVFRGERHGLHTRVFLNSAGFPLYEAKELGLAKLKEETWPFDRSITVTAVEQKELFKVIKAAMSELFPELASKITYVDHGMLRFASGKMSSRKGNVITGESLIADVEEIVQKRMKDSRAVDAHVATNVAVAAIKFAILRQSAGKDIIFDAEKSLSLEGDSGPYLQYAHTRAVSVLTKAKEAHIEAGVERLPLLPYPLERMLYQFPEVVARAAAEYEPHYITTYLTRLAGAFNTFYASERILDDKEFASYKLALTQAFAHTIKNGLWLLGIVAPEKM